MQVFPEGGSTFMNLIGGQRATVEDGRVVITLELEERHMNPNGVLHGGVLTTLMDEATGHAVATVRGIETMMQAPHATVDMNMSFLSGARPGDVLECEGRVLRVGKSVCFAEGEVRRRGKGDLIAKGRFTFVVVSPRNG
ncbi:MAG TPA: PaaI family thioesterase [Dehalococcoidia bacterium]|nr:PaaI family thioesterase [Dehalococcoidia bacterium]